MNCNIKSAIIGYWRSGAEITRISEITELSIKKVKEIINDYQRIKENNKVVNLYEALK